MFQKAKLRNIENKLIDFTELKSFTCFPELLLVFNDGFFDYLVYISIHLFHYSMYFFLILYKV
jgi:hypothetical protein